MKATIYYGVGHITADFVEDCLLSGLKSLNTRIS